MISLTRFYSSLPLSSSLPEKLTTAGMFVLMRLNVEGGFNYAQQSWRPPLAIGKTDNTSTSNKQKEAEMNGASGSECAGEEDNLSISV